MNNRAHSVLLTRPLHCPTALIILIPPRGGSDGIVQPWNVVLWHREVNVQEQRGRESNNKIKGFVTLQIYREAKSLCLWAHEVAGARRGVWGKATEVAVQCKSPQGFTTKRNGEPLTLVMKLFEHLEKGIDNTLKNHLPVPFHSPSL